MEIRQCPVCHSNEFKMQFRASDYLSQEEFPMSQCKQCNSFFLNEVPEPHLIGNYYNNDAGATMRTKPSSFFQSLQRVRLGNEYRIFSNYIKKDMCVFDLGCGDGAFADYLNCSGVNISAVDFYPISKWCNNKINYFQTDLNNFPINARQQFGVPIDFAILRHNLEHLYNPAQIIRKLYDNNTKYVWIVVPNVNSFLRRVFGRNWNLWDPPRHLVHFNISSLTDMLADNGYYVIKCEYYSFDEVLSSLYQILKRNNLGDTFPFKYMQAKSPLVGLSSAISSLFPLKTVMGVLAERQ